MLFTVFSPEVLADASKTKLLAYLESVAVGSVHKELNRHQFKITKQEDETVIDKIISLQIIAGIKTTEGRFMLAMGVVDTLSKCIVLKVVGFGIYRRQQLLSSFLMHHDI